MPVIDYIYREGAWRPHEYGTGPIVLGGRDGLVAGVHEPIPANVGPTVDTFTETGTGGAINLGAGTYAARRFWGRVSIPAGSGTYVFRDSKFHGPDPANGQSMLSCFNVSSGFTGTILIEDCVIDPMPWVTEQGKAGLSPWVNGINGAGFTVRRTEITNVVDGISIIGTPTHTPTTIELNWIHKGFFEHNFAGQSDLRTHCDGIQFHRGKNVTIRGNVIGGQRDMTGYQATWGDGSNTGDDFENACIMLKQEVSASDADKIENVLIESNWLRGSMASINAAYTAARPNTFASTIIRANRIGDRAAGDGITRRSDGELRTTNTNGGLGFYIIRANALQAEFTGNVLETTGAPAPITGG